MTELQSFILATILGPIFIVGLYVARKLIVRHVYKKEFNKLPQGRVEKKVVDAVKRKSYSKTVLYQGKVAVFLFAVSLYLFLMSIAMGTYGHAKVASTVAYIALGILGLAFGLGLFLSSITKAYDLFDEQPSSILDRLSAKGTALKPGELYHLQPPKGSKVQPIVVYDARRDALNWLNKTLGEMASNPPPPPKKPPLHSV